VADHGGQEARSGRPSSTDRYRCHYGGHRPGLDEAGEMRFELKDDVDAPIKIVVARKVVSVDQLAEELNSCRASYQT
jgi:hypothetical protein